MIEHGLFADPIETTVARFARQYPVERDDLRQEVLLQFYGDTFQGNLDARDEVARDRYVQGMARTVCARVGLAEKARVEGFSPDDIYQYGPEQVAVLLEYLFGWRRDGALPQGAQDDIRVSSSAVSPARRGSMEAQLVDVARVLDGFTAEEQWLLECRHWTGLEFEEIAELLDGTPQAAQKRCRRLLRRACDQLNEFRRQGALEHDGPGSRRAMSNAAAQQQVRQ
jgi:hypothetical protein